MRKRIFGVALATAFAGGATAVALAGPPPNSGPPLPTDFTKPDGKSIICHYSGHSHYLPNSGKWEYDWVVKTATGAQYCVNPQNGSEPGIVITVDDNALDGHMVGTSTG
jgi:hypothetical protein